MNKTQQGQFRKTVAEQLEQMAAQLDKEHGIRHRLLVSGEGADLRFSVKFEEPHKSGVAMRYRRGFKVHAEKIGLDPNSLDRKFVVGPEDAREEWVIAGINPRARENPVLVQNVQTQEIRKAPVELINKSIQG